MLDKLRMLKRDLPTLKTMTQAGGRLSKELHGKFAELAASKNIKFCVMYGASEATARMSYLPSEYNKDKVGSIGIAIPGGRFELLDNDGKVITEAHKSGELVYYGDNVTLGYAKRGEDLILGDERHGKLLTGDIAERDDDGFYYIVGRKKRFLKMFGKRVNLDEVEQLLKQRFSSYEIACTGVDDKIFVFLTENDHDDDIIEFLSDTLRLHSSAFSVNVIESIPKNPSGKTLYSELLQYCR
jgi:acyl-coenzyme A synthetase/AMP-(fatty) acid ligase